MKKKEYKKLVIQQSREIRKLQTECARLKKIFSDLIIETNLIMDGTKNDMQ